MIEYVIGDATKPEGEGLKYITHCCNDIGAWGAGFVISLSRRWPQPQQAYQLLEEYELGDVQFVPVEKDIIVCNLIGQHSIAKLGSEGRSPIRYDAIYDGLIKINRDVVKHNGSIHMPRMGSGLAGGHWLIIEEIIKAVCTSPVTVYDLP